jgi:hypothetical protein
MRFSGGVPLSQARAAIQEDDDHETALHTGSQWVILDRSFCTYLVTDSRALRWHRIFQRRFLSDEAFVQTVCGSPLSIVEVVGG